MLALPQPFEDLGHVADVGVRVRGRSAEEALERLALALGTLLSGGAAPAPAPAEERLAVAGGPGLAGTAVALLRELLFRFATEGIIPVAVEVARVDEAGAEARVRWGRYDPELHAEGMDVKAVTWHLALLEHRDGEWVGQAVFDI
jgi:SHS2 domain-containing protein